MRHMLLINVSLYKSSHVVLNVYHHFQWRPGLTGHVGGILLFSPITLAVEDIFRCKAVCLFESGFEITFQSITCI